MALPKFSLDEELRPGGIRRFDTGASRDTDAGKLDYEGFLSPDVIDAFARYMNKNRKMADGSLRDSDNWQKGIPIPVYMKSMFRHFMDVWRLHRGLTARENMEDALCGLLFNVQGYLHEYLKSPILNGPHTVETFSNIAGVDNLGVNVEGRAVGLNHDNNMVERGQS